MHQSPPLRPDDKVSAPLRRERRRLERARPSARHLALTFYFTLFSNSQDGHLQYELGENITPVYKILAPLGEGTFGRVLECWDRKFRSYCAIKIIRNVQKYRDAAKIEIDVLKTVQKNDPTGKFNCIKMQTWFDYRGHICMVFEKCGLSLFDFLRKNHYRPFSVGLVQQYARQLLHAVAFLHTLKLVHTDLKPENILLLSSAYQRVPVSSGSKFTKRVPMDPTIRLIDFGSATFEHQHHSSVVSTRHYRAPEVILGMGWSYPCDIWSIGCILVELLTGDALFQTHENLEHLAMMEVVLGPIPKTVVARADAGPAPARGLRGRREGTTTEPVGARAAIARVRSARGPGTRARRHGGDAQVDRRAAAAARARARARKAQGQIERLRVQGEGTAEGASAAQGGREAAHFRGRRGNGALARGRAQVPLVGARHGRRGWRRDGYRYPRANGRRRRRSKRARRGSRRAASPRTVARGGGGRGAPPAAPFRDVARARERDVPDEQEPGRAGGRGRGGDAHRAAVFASAARPVLLARQDARPRRSGSGSDWRFHPRLGWRRIGEH